MVPRSVKGYFSVKNPKMDWYKWLIGFWRYLRSPDASNMKDEIVRPMPRRSETSWKPSTDGPDIQCLVKESGQAVWNS